MVRGLRAVIFGSSCLMEPAARLRGLAYGFLPSLSSSLFSFSKSAMGIYASPRGSSTSGGSSSRRSGVERMVLSCAVQAPHAGVPLPQVFYLAGVRKGEHGDGVPDLLEPLDGLAADALGR